MMQSPNVTALCRRLASSDETLNVVRVDGYNDQKIEILLRALRATDTNHQVKVRTLCLENSRVTADSLLDLLSFFCRRRRAAGDQINDADNKPSLLDSFHMIAFDDDDDDEDDEEPELNSSILQRLFQGMASDQPPGLGDLMELSFQNGHWDEFSATAIQEALSSTKCQLTSLRLLSNRITDQHLEILVAGLLSSECVLETLNLSQNNIGNVGAVQLARVVSHGDSILRELDLTKNSIGDLGAVALAMALQEQPRRQSLTTLCLGENNIGAAGATALVTAVTAHPTLVYWSINQNPIQPTGFCAMVESVPNFRNIKTFHLGPFMFEWRHELRDGPKLIASIETLAAGMEQNHSLEELVLFPASADFLGGERTFYELWHEYQRDALQSNRCLLIPSRHIQLQRVFNPSKCLDLLSVIAFFTNLNRLKLRHILFHHDLHLGLWPIILEQAFSFPSLIFYMLREQPNLTTFHRPTNEPNKTNHSELSNEATLVAVKNCARHPNDNEGL